MTVEIPLTRGMVALIDEEDEERVRRWRWYAREGRGGLWYATAAMWIDQKTKQVRMHRFIMDAPHGLEVDHVDNDPLNNQKSNLRLASRPQNAANTRSKKGSTSKYKGVSWDKAARKWHARIEAGGRRRYLGRFVKEEDAAMAYDLAAKAEYGEFARLNFPEKVAQ